MSTALIFGIRKVVDKTDSISLKKNTQKQLKRSAASHYIHSVNSNRSYILYRKIVPINKEGIVKYEN